MDDINWVDPDILEYYGGDATGLDAGSERAFKEFFETGWLDPKYDHLRERWDPLISDPEPQGRVLGKTALWSFVQYLDRLEQRRARDIAGQEQKRVSQVEL